MPEAAPVREISLAREMEESYLEYAMSTIISRALPDARDGLKPAQRRILMAMYDLRLYPNRQHLKSAKVAGQTSGDYHPHGEGIVYPTMVRLAQEFNMRYPLIEGQGNFGSIDGDPPAAMRYCVTGDALVVTDQGLIPIAQLSAGPEDIPIQVLSADGGVNTARKWFDCGEHPTWQVRTRHGYEIRGTANHPLLVCQPDEKGRPVFAWKTMEQIEVGDWLVLDRSENLWPEGLVDLSPYHPVFPPNSGVQPHPLPEKLKETLAFLLGALVAEATFQPHRIEFTLTPRDFAAAFYQAWRETFPTCRLHTWLRNPVSYGKRHFWQMQVVSQQVVAFLRNLGLQGQSTQRHIPEVVLRSPRQVVAAFLRGLFEGEGNPQRFGNSRLRISLCSRSQTLLKQVQVLLLRFGIASTRRPRGRNGGWLCITGLENLRRFAEQIGFVSEAKKEALADMLQVHSEAGLSQMDFVSFLASFVPQIAARHREWLRKHHFDRPARLARALPCLMQALPKPDAPWAQFLALRRYLFDPIVSLEYAGRHRVYSLRVDSDCHSFVANGFINHNTEVRLAPLAMEMLEDLDKDTVDFRPNYDERLEEPVVLPSKFPNLLCNGSEGIAVGMSTKIPPHNLNEVAEAICAYIDHPDIAVEELMEYIPGPDFPTQGIILGTKGIRDMYTRGRGSITLQARALIEEIEGGRTAIIITELPYQVNKAHLQEQIAALVNARRISGISALRDETDRNGMRLVIELRRDAVPHVVLNQLYKHTPLRTNFPAILLALVDGTPRLLDLKRLIATFVAHRQEVLTRRTRFQLRAARAREHILKGLLLALDHLDEIIALIRASENRSAARDNLRAQFNLSERQAQAIVDMTLGSLTGLERRRLEDEYKQVRNTIAYLEDLLANPHKILALIKKEQQELARKYGDPRRTTLRLEEAEDLRIEDLIAEEDMVITLTRDGYAKRLPVDTYRVQRRGGKGLLALTKKEEDVVEHFFVATTHHYILFFTNRGRVYRLRAFEIPQASRQAKGTPIVNMVPLQPDEHITATIPVPNFERPEGYLVMLTRRGTIKKTALEEFRNIHRSGLIAIHLAEKDELGWVRWTDGQQQLVVATCKGMSVRFKESDVRPMGRAAQGVRAIRLRPGDEVVGFDLVDETCDLLVVGEYGYGKRTSFTEYRLQSRGGIGIITYKITPKTGKVVGVEVVDEEDEIMLLTENGVLIRIPVKRISRLGRSTQGVKLIDLAEGDRVKAVTKVVRGEEETEEEPVQLTLIEGLASK